MRRPTGWIFLGLTLLAQTAVGEEIYRSVDAQGNVIFTDSPPAGDTSVERVELPPGSSAESLEQTEQRNREIRKAVDQAERKRLQQQQQKAARIKAATEQLADAEAKLAEAKVLKDEDRQNLAGGKRRIHPDYFERVKQAEEAVEVARKALRAARGY